MPKITNPRTTLRTRGPESLVGYTEDGLEPEDIQRSLAASQVVNQASGAGRRAEYPELLSDGVRENSDVLVAVRCDLCGHVFGLESMVRFQGKYFCTVHECAAEVLRAQGLPIQGKRSSDAPDWDLINSSLIMATDDGYMLVPDDWAEDNDVRMSADL